MYEAPPPPPSPPRQQTPIKSLKKNKSTSKTSDISQKTLNPKKEVTKTKVGTGNSR